MSVKYVTHTVDGQISCDNCNCREVFLCIHPSSQDMIVGAPEYISAKISECSYAYEVAGTIEKEKLCLDKIIIEKTNVITVKTTLKFMYDTDLLVDIENPLNDGDITCVSLDSCMHTVLTNAGVTSINGTTGIITLDDIDDSTTDHKFVEVQTGYTASNVTTTRSFDANAVSLSELADVVGTLINDLKNGKIPGA